MNSTEIRELSDNEIQKKLRDTREEHVQLRLRKQTGQVEHPHQFKQLRRDIARLETILRQKKMGAA